MICLRIDAPPPKATAQQKGVFVVNGKPRFFTKAAQAQAERNTTALLVAAKPAGMQPLEGPLAVTLRLVWPYRKTERKAVVRDGLEIPMPVRPDADNVAKAMLDAIGAAGFWRDDAQVTRLELVKRWGPVGYWDLTISADGPLEEKEGETTYEQ